MASKGQKFNKYTAEFKEKILKEYFDGLGGTIYLGKKYGISYHTIDNWIQKIQRPEVAKNTKRGRPKQVEKIDYKERYEILKKYQTFIEARHKIK